MLPLQRHGFVLRRLSAGLTLPRGIPAAGLYRLHWGGHGCGGAFCLICLARAEWMRTPQITACAEHTGAWRWRTIQTRVEAAGMQRISSTDEVERVHGYTSANNSFVTTDRLSKSLSCELFRGNELTSDLTALRDNFLRDPLHFQVFSARAACHPELGFLSVAVLGSRLLRLQDGVFPAAQGSLGLYILHGAGAPLAH